jgi:Lamin Tail Domain
MRGLGAVSLITLVACGPDGGPGGQCKDSLVVGDLVITEVFADFKAPTGGSGVDDGKEWFEIYNASDRPVELEGLRIDHSRPDGSKVNSHVMLAVTIAPGQYFTLANATPDLVPAYIDYGYSTDLGDFFNSDGGKLALACGDTEIDSATYEAVKEGKSRQLTSATFPDYILNDDINSWCEAKDTEFETGNFGTPGGENDCTPVIVGACNENGTSRPTVSPMPGELVITELMPQPLGTDTDQEWFEVKALASFDLNGLTLDRASEMGNSDTVTSPDCLSVNAGDYVIFVNKLDPLLNGGLPAAAIRGTFGFSLVNGTVAAPGDIQILSGATVIDAVSWTDSNAGVSLALDPDLEDATANDQLSNFCDGVGMYGAGGAGTPGAANGQCTLLPPAGSCDEGGTIRPIVKPAAGALVITEVLANPANVADGTTDAQKEWFEILNTSGAPFDLNELTMKSPGTAGTVIQSAACIVVAPAGFALIARSSDPTKNGMLPTPDVTFNFSLVDSGANAGVSMLDGATVLDAVTWTSVGSGLTTALDPDHLNTTDNDVFNVTAGVACRGATGYGDMTNKGTPRAANEQCP